MTDPQPQTVKPQAFEPPPAAPPPRGLRVSPLAVLLALVFAALAGCAWFVLTATSVNVTITPAPDQRDVRGGLALEIGGNFLLRPGSYTFVAHKVGYHPLEEAIEVPAGEPASFSFDLKKLPGRLQLSSEPEGATVYVDGVEAGSTPLVDHKLEPGVHHLEVRAERYKPFETEVTIEGLDKIQSVSVSLEPDWAAYKIASVPGGATIYVDGIPRGSTPEEGHAEVEIGAGSRLLSLILEGYKPWEQRLRVVAGDEQTLAPVVLEPASGRLAVTTQPAGASVSVDGEYRGRSPLTLALKPDKPSEIRLSKAGYRSETRKTAVPSNQEQSLSVTLEPVTGVLRVRASPDGVRLRVNGEDRGAANQDIRLVAVPQSLEFSKPGYATVQRTVTPKPGFAQRVDVRLLTDYEAWLAGFPETIETAVGIRLKRIEPGSFTMGSPRREQGRQANETQRDVKLTRLFYLATHEVTNAQYRQFRGGHSSGIVERKTLDNDNFPVARVSWEDAVAFCNWLSDKEGLPRAYRDGKLITPATTGYRLPTEAEWAWAARFAGGRDLKYPWGPEMPPTGRAGNYADVSAIGLIREHLNSYNDGYPAAAPVGRFAPNALGIHDLGGNVSEWVNDVFGAEPGLGGVSTDPLGAGDGKLHVIRGSSWRHGRITELRLSWREARAGPRDDLGFRVARYAE